MPLSETVGADALVAKVVTDDFQLLLHSSGSDREDEVVLADGVSQAIILNVLCDYQGYSEDALLAGFLLDNLQMIAASILNDIPAVRCCDVADADAQIGFQNRCCGNALIGPTAKPCFVVWMI